MSKLNQAQRDALPDEKFADPANRKFPILDCSDVEDAWNLAGHAAQPERVRAQIIRFASTLHCPLMPAMKTWLTERGGMR